MKIQGRPTRFFLSSSGDLCDPDRQYATVREKYSCRFGRIKTISQVKSTLRAGVVVRSPHGDGTVQVYAKLDDLSRVSAVFFSFDGERPPSDL
jgi:hypothetical protein